MNKVTDPALLNELNASSGGREKVTDPELLLQLNAPPPPPRQPASEAATGIPAEAWANAERLRWPETNPEAISGPSVYARPPTMALDDPRRAAMIGAQSAMSGFGSIPAIPADIGALGLNILAIGADNIASRFGSDMFSGRVPVASAEATTAVGEGARALGIPAIPRYEMTAKERLAYDANEALFNGLGLGALFRAGAKRTAARSTAPKADAAPPATNPSVATPVAEQGPAFMSPYDRLMRRGTQAVDAVDPVTNMPGRFHLYKQPYMAGDGNAVMAGNAVSDVLGAGVSNFVAENMPAGWSEATRGGADLFLGLTGAKAGNIAGRGVTNFAINGPANAAAAFSRSWNPYDRTIPVDPLDYGAVKKSTADLAADIMQGRVVNAGEVPSDVAQTLRDNQQAYVDANLPIPTAGALSGSVGMLELEGGQRPLNTGAFAARDNQLRDAGAQSLSDLGPLSRENPSMTPLERDAAGVPFVRAVEDEKARRISEAEAAIADAQRQADALADERNVAAAELAASQDNRPATTAQRQIGQMAIDTRNAENAASNTLYSDPAIKTAEVVPNAAVQKAQEISAGQTQENPLPPRVAPFVQRIQTLIEGNDKVAPSIIAVDKYGIEQPQPTREPGIRTTTVGELQKLSNDIEAGIVAAKNNFEGANTTGALIELKKAVDDYKTGLMGDSAEALAAAEKNFRERTLVFRQGAGGDLDLALRRDNTGTATRPADIGRMLTETPEDVSDLRKIAALGGNEAMTEKGLREIVFNSLAGTKVLRETNGRVMIDATALRAWVQKNGDYLEGVPAVRDELMTMLRRSEGHENLAAQYKAGIETATKNLKLTQEQTNAGAFALVVGNSPSVAVANLFSRSGNPPANADQLMSIIRGNKAAEDGLKQAVADYIVRRVSSVNPTSPKGALSIREDAGQRAVNLGALIKFMNEPDTQNVLAKIYTPQEMMHLRRARMALEPLTQSFARSTSGSQTAERYANMLRTVEAGLRTTYGSVAGGSMMRSVRLLVGAVNEPGQIALNRLLERAILEPDVAAALLSRDLKKDSPLYSAAAQKLVRQQREAARQFGPEMEETAEPQDENTKR